ncbi:MAG: metallophosphoesterase [Proteobacteria bacterium]|nr:metallophosphoesterase [Pseudomonadota bacterium]
MIGFLVVYFLIYTGIHTAVWFDLRVILPDSPTFRIFTLAFFLIMIAAPVASWFLEDLGYHRLSRASAWAGFLWMGLVLMLSLTLLAAWLVHIGFRLISLAPGWTFIPDPRFMALAAAVLAGLLTVYGMIEAQSIRIERVRLETTKLPPGLDHLKIAQISDLHVGPMTRVSRIERIADLIEREKPDLLVSTGDLVDGHALPYEDLKRLFGRIKPRLGKFAVPGNHEVYVGLDWSRRCLEHCGFKLLRNEALTLAGTINLAGVDDPAARSVVNETRMLESAGNHFYTILLKHQPRVRQDSPGRFDLQLSGHTHRGQIFPFNFVTGAIYPMQDGLYRLANGSALYTSRGTGSWGPPLRILAPPEITIIEIVSIAGK